MKDISNTHLFQEIHAQPEVVARFLSGQQAAAETLAAAIRARSITQVVIAARGTSDNAGRYAQYVLGAFNQLSVALATPSLFSVYGRPPMMENALVLGISQSGKSPDIVAVLAEARRQGALTAAITNVPESDLAGQADVVIDLMAGPEQAVAATKTYTTQLAAIALLSATLADDAAMKAQLSGIPTAMRATLLLAPTVATLAPRYRYMSRSVVIGRGFNYSTAFELALKLQELTYIPVDAYSSADFMHGPLAIVERGFPVVVVAPAGAMAAEMAGFVATLDERGAEVVAISDVAEVLAQARIPLALPVTVAEWLSPLTCVMPGQLLAMHISHACDYDVDQPRAIRKVTETL